MSDKNKSFYKNPAIPEGINTSADRHPIATFIKLFSAIALILVVGAWLLGKSGSYLASLIPYSQETSLVSHYEMPPEEDTEIQRYLDKLTTQISAAMQLPDGMTIQVHYVNDKVENAFATLGGNIFLYKGLLDKLPNENALSMVIAHEIAHIKHRDPMRSVGQSIAISTGFALLLGKSEINVLGSAGLYTQLKFSRDMETASDVEGLTALVKHYGHGNGATDLFAVLDKIAGHSLLPEASFFVTHPYSKDRIHTLEKIAQQKQWKMDSAVTPLPDGFQQWLETKTDE